MKKFQQIGAINIRLYPRILNRCIRSFTSNTLPEPPLLLKMRSDMKNAMREKDKNRLNVLRGVLADIINSSKINRAITQDSQVVAILKSRLKLSENAAAEFAAAEREDLKANEEAQVSILQGYLDGLETVPEKDIKNAALKALDILRLEGKKIHQGAVIKLLLSPDAPFQGKHLDMPSVTRIVREIVISNQIETQQDSSI